MEAEREELRPVLPHDAPVRAELIHPPVREVRTLLSWRAPGRPFRKKGKEYYLNVLVIMFAIEVILFLFAQYMLMVLVIALVFLTFVLATIPPHDFHYKITTQGITVEDHFYYWNELFDFYFRTIDGVEVVHIATKAYIPGELTLTLGDIHSEQLKAILLPYLPYREVVRPTILEQSSDWLSRTFPLERQSAERT